MPELPEVESIVRTLAAVLAGTRLKGVRHVRQDMVKPDDFDLVAALSGRRIAEVRRRAKRIVITLDTEERFFIHLGMTGRLTIENAAAPRKKHTHLILELSSGAELRLVDPRRFGAIVWLGRADHHDVGPEPLTLSPAKLGKILKKTRRAVKVALLDQTMIAGIGNIYADEALHAAGIDPNRPANSLEPSEIGRLNRGIKRVLRRAIAAGGSSIRDYVDANGNPGDFQKLHLVYDRKGHPCRRCKSPIERIVLGGRSTHFCRKCQQ